MSPNAVPAASSSSALKRRREDTAGGSVPTALFYSDGPSASATPAPSNASTAPQVVQTNQYGAVWQSIHSALVAGGHPVPSPNMVATFADIHLKSLNDYKGAQTSLQRATATCNGFTQSAAGGAPAVVTNHLKLPAYQLVKSAPGVDTDPRVCEALKAANECLVQVQESATQLLSTVYTVQIEYCKQQTNAGAAADRFAAAIGSYCNSVVIGSGFDDKDRYETAVAMLKSAFIRELEELAIDFTAKLMKTNAMKEAKAVTLANARADAEMTDATKPVTELIGDEIKSQLALQLPALLESMKKASAPAASSSKTPASSSTKQKSLPKRTQAPKPKPAPAAQASSSNNKAKRTGNRVSAGGAKHQGTSAKAKGKAKQTEEESDNSS
ncbi:hypothetical protein C8R46DRAFT_1206471 [Mycena filopes]|nr:hypothetical protein C8R46DRAFT_1206471 [Mycena filopes]